jgi:hypothetical protein
MYEHIYIGRKPIPLDLLLDDEHNKLIRREERIASHAKDMLLALKAGLPALSTVATSDAMHAVGLALKVINEIEGDE